MSFRGAGAAAALLLAGVAGPAAAGGTLEFDPKYESFESRAACEAALQRRHGAALARLAALPAPERRSNRVDGLKRDGDEQLTYSEVLDLSSGTPDSIIPGSQTEYFTCRGNRLEHRVSLGENKPR
ncbi:MAG TPA: hypothetical protein VFQ67_17890 [Allosphingosinicella sp.]|jgi:hypothetical protein|nr:hypothetical protein [Allosphingosinicella sp.]